MRKAFVVGMAALVGLGFALYATAGSEAAPPPVKKEFVGEKKCKKCHIKQHKTWKKMPHAKNFELLAEKYRNDTEKDESGKLCVSCHTTGYGIEGGPATVAEATEMGLLGTQCEACHGPGSLHIELNKKHEDADEIPDEVREAINRVPQNACIGCHNPHVSHEKYKEG